MTNTDIYTRVQEALKRTEIMALSTIGADGSWTIPVQYQYDEKLNLFFSSMIDAKHVANIHKDPRVSVAIYSHPGPPGGNIGLQIKGWAGDITKNSESWHRFKITPIDVVI